MRNIRYKILMKTTKNDDQLWKSSQIKVREFGQFWNKTVGLHRYLFCPNTKFLINFWKYLKNEISVLNQVIKSSPEISIQALISAIHGSIELSRARMKVRSSTCFCWIAVWKFNTILCDLDNGNPARTFSKNEFLYRQKSQQIVLSPILTLENKNAGKKWNIFL